VEWRIRKGDVVYELIEPPEGNDQRMGVIVFPGLPNQPRSEDFGDNLAKEGFYVLQPRYIGSWESYGRFSIKNCIKTVVEAEKLLQGGKAIECWGEKKIEWDLKKIFILSSSFGSSIVLSALPKLSSKEIICLAPLTNLNKHNSDKNIQEQDLSVLGGFLQRGFENAFRHFELDEWEDFIKGKTEANPILYTKNVKDKNIFLIHGEKDEVVNISRTEEYYNEIKSGNKVIFEKVPGIGHGGELKKACFKKVVDYMKGASDR